MGFMSDLYIASRISSSGSIKIKTPIYFLQELDDPAKNRTVLLSEHHNRWIQVRRKWLDQTNLYRKRYEPSIKLLDAIYKP